MRSYQPKFWQDQFSSLYALSTIGMSYYNAGQFTLRHPTSHGLTLDFSYTWSNSIDMGSDTERSNEFGTNATNTGSFSEILNTWKPYLNRGPSDFDTRHLITADWVYQLPFGRGKAVLGSANGLLDAFIGGWQWSGINRWTSGLPFSLTEPGWSTDWQIESFGVSHRPRQDAQPLRFQRQPAVLRQSRLPSTPASAQPAAPIRLPYPGEAGQRNNFRGDGYFDIDSGLDQDLEDSANTALSSSPGKSTTSPTPSASIPPSSDRALPAATSALPAQLLTVPRRMQFSLRYRLLTRLNRQPCRGSPLSSGDFSLSPPPSGRFINRQSSSLLLKLSRLIRFPTSSQERDFTSDNRDANRILPSARSPRRRGPKSALNALPLLLIVLGIFAVAYRYYSAFLASRAFALDDRNITPAHRFNDGHNYVPSPRWVVFGHHFAAIAGAGPLVGPTLAAQFGYRSRTPLAGRRRSPRRRRPRHDRPHRLHPSRWPFAPPHRPPRGRPGYRHRGHDRRRHQPHHRHGRPRHRRRQRAQPKPLGRLHHRHDHPYRHRHGLVDVPQHSRPCSRPRSLHLRRRRPRPSRSSPDTG